MADMIKLLVVESPTKAKTIGRFLASAKKGGGYKVVATVGHLRDLPKSKMGVDLTGEVKVDYVVDKTKSKVIRELKQATKQAGEVYLATDMDREGEAIAWHTRWILRDSNKKISLLVHLLGNDHSGTVMIFCNTKRDVDFVARNLKNQGISAQAIHGGFTQSKRNKALENFQNEKVKILVCTDVAARGLDIKGVSHVYNFSIPKEIKQYVHRIGRTARAGKDGKAINLLAKSDHFDFSRLLKDYKLDIEKRTRPDFKIIKLDEVRRRPSSRNGFTRTFSRGKRKPKGTKNRRKWGK